MLIHWFSNPLRVLDFYLTNSHQNHFLFKFYLKVYALGFLELVLGDVKVVKGKKVRQFYIALSGLQDAFSEAEHAYSCIFYFQRRKNK